MTPLNVYQNLYSIVPQRDDLRCTIHRTMDLALVVDAEHKRIDVHLTALHDSIKGISLNLSTAIGELYPAVSNLKERVGLVEDSVEEEKAKLVALQAMVRLLESQKVALADYNTKMQAVDSLMASLTASSTKSGNRLDTAERNITDLTTALSQERSAIEALQATVSLLSSLPGTVKEHQQAIVGMSAHMEERKAEIEDLQKQMANDTAAIKALQIAEASTSSKVSTLEAASKLQTTTNETFTSQISSVQQRIAENEAQLDREKAKAVSLSSQVGDLNDRKVARSEYNEEVLTIKSKLSSQETSLAKTKKRLRAVEKINKQLEAALAREESEKAALKKQVEIQSEEKKGLETNLNQTMQKLAELEERIATMFALMSSNQTKTDADVQAITGSLQRKVEVIEDRLGEVGRQFDTKLNQTDAEVASLQESVTTLSTLTMARSRRSGDYTQLLMETSSSPERTPSPRSIQRVTFTRSASQKTLAEN